MTIEIILLGEANRDLLDNIGPEVFDNEIEPAQLTAFLKDRRHVMYLAIDAGTVVGMASAFEHFHPDKAPQMFINEVGVATSHRNRGIGRNLVQTLIDNAIERGCNYAWLGTDVDNKAGQACFGAVPEGEKPQPFLLFEWDLED